MRLKVFFQLVLITIIFVILIAFYYTFFNQKNEQAKDIFQNDLKKDDILIDDRTNKLTNIEYNSIDKVNNETILLHTSNRITQPWKEDLEINFERYNLKVKDYLKYYFKKIFNKNYNNNLFAKKFVKHPNDKVYATVKNLFNEAIKNNFIQNYEIEEAISKGYISKKILN